MPGGFHLSEEDERAEIESRDRIRHAQGRLRELRDRRGLLLDQIHRLSEEQRAVHDRMAPDRQRVDATHEEYREFGHRLAEMRSRREALRARLDAAVAGLRPARPAPGAGANRRARGGPPLPAALRREIAELELRQQTQVLPVAEENALLDHLRQLRRDLAEAEKAAGIRAAEEASRADQELSFQALRTEFEELGRAMDRLRTERDQRMGAIRTQLLTVGQEISEIREKARLRAELFRKVDELSRQMAELDREVRDALVASQARRKEARDTVRDYNRSAREAVSGSAAAAQTAEENLAQLLKGGKIVLSG